MRAHQSATALEQMAAQSRSVTRYQVRVYARYRSDPEDVCRLDGLITIEELDGPASVPAHLAPAREAHTGQSARTDCTSKHNTVLRRHAPRGAHQEQSVLPARHPTTE